MTFFFKAPQLGTRPFFFFFSLSLVWFDLPYHLHLLNGIRLTTDDDNDNGDNDDDNNNKLTKINFIQINKFNNRNAMFAQIDSQLKRFFLNCFFEVQNNRVIWPLYFPICPCVYSVGLSLPPPSDYLPFKKWWNKRTEKKMINKIEKVSSASTSTNFDADKPYYRKMHYSSINL